MSGEPPDASAAIDAPPTPQPRDDEPVGDPIPDDSGPPPVREPDREPPAKDPGDEPPAGDPSDEPPAKDPGDAPPAGDPPDDAPAIDVPSEAPPARVASDPPTAHDVMALADSLDDDAPFSSEIDVPPPMSVPRPAPYVPPKVVPPATVSDVSPEAGSILGDTRLTITGENLFRESIVRIGGQIARTVGAVEPRELRVLTPARSTPGLVDMTIQNPNSPEVVIAKAFRYEPLPPPKISSVAPDHLPTRGGEITIVGTGFVSSTVVLLAGVEAAKVARVDATTLDVTVPAGEHGRAIDVTVQNPDGKRDVARRAFVHDERYDR